MGRTKAVPQRKEVSLTQDRTLLEGRQTLPRDVRVDLLLAAEIEEHTSLTAVSEDAATRIEPEEEASFLDHLERKYAQPKRKSKRTQKSKKRRKKCVSFASESSVVAIIPPPEVSLCNEEDGSCKIIVQMRPSPPPPSDFRLCTIRLPDHVSVEYHDDEQLHANNTTAQSYQLSTALAIADVIRLVVPALYTEQLIAAAHRGTITLQLASNECHVVLLAPQTRLSLSLVRALLQWPLSLSSSLPITARRVYGLVDNKNHCPRKKTLLSILHLVPTLRPYQESAVHWMLKRERSVTPLGCWECAWISTSTGTPLMDARTQGPFYNVVTGNVVRTQEQAQAETSAAIVRGGILGEAMGLGKTVEVLACILANPWKPPPLSSMPQRQLHFEPLQEEDESGEQQEGVGTVDDMADFGDADDDDSDDGSIVSATTTTPATSATVVTPERRRSREPETWIDDTIVGACICGNLIGFGDDDTGPIVTCRQCEEPMHEECAFLDGLQSDLKPMQYRQRFTNRRLASRICEECPCCVERQPCGTTLIVTPRAILSQWEREIERHTKRENGKPLNVVVYHGVKQHAASPGESQYLHPRRLAQADVVLMTFDALRSDLGHADNPYAESSEGKLLRTRKRYRVVPTPLLGLEWWRLCLDEAQRVESPTVQSAQMALKLKAVNRWCVSGTPVGRGKLEDLHGLLLFLGVQPFDNKTWFKKCLDPSLAGVDRRIQHLLKDFFWRSTRANDAVREQMGVPAQEEKKVVLKFSSIEKHFYERQLQATLEAAGDLSDQRGKRGKSSKKLNALSERLHKLRAACCHPQVGSGGIGSMRKRGRTRETNLGSRVMSMSQILDKFIDDGKLQCEESQRLVVMHTNAMAAISRLKVEAKQRGVTINESENDLLMKSCELYTDSMKIADENAQATLMLGEVTVSGSVGFLSQQVAEKCSLRMDWQWSANENKDEVWARLDFAATSRKVLRVRFRPLSKVPDDVKNGTSEAFKWRIVEPKSCELQCMDAHGEFQTVHSFAVDCRAYELVDWLTETGFRSNKSKCWRLVLQPTPSKETNVDRHDGSYIGMDVEFDEAAIANDPLQRLHCLHNASLSFQALLKNTESDAGSESYLGQSRGELKTQSGAMAAEVEKLEELYLNAAEGLHEQNRRRFDVALQRRSSLENELVHLNTMAQGSNMEDIWDDGWWDDFLTMCHLHGTEDQKRSVCDHVYQDLEGFIEAGISTTHSRNSGVIPFPLFDDISGLRTAIQMRMRAIRSGLGTKAPRVSDGTGFPAPRGGRFRSVRGGHASCMSKILQLPKKPTSKEIAENSHCKVCKADWFQTGPECRHCKIGEELEDLEPDNVTLLVLRSLHRLVKGQLGALLFGTMGSAALIEQRSNQFFEVLGAMKREQVMAWRFWRVHLDLLNDIDELHQCKNAMRLTHEDEDVTKLTAEELNAVVMPYDVCARFHDHAAKQAMAWGALKRGKGTLQYLKNLREVEQQPQNTIGTFSDKKDENDSTCMICLSTFHTNRAVLRCGHSVHADECFDKLQSRSRGHDIVCPFRCRIHTKRNEVMIASTQSHHDGSHTKRQVKGSFGTKVTALVSDIMEVTEKGDKCLVFSQWEDMLDICGQALSDNSIPFVRASSARGMGVCVQNFRRSDMFVMLLNVKSGAEGLTLLEATHIFMVEPLLNPGLDSQAISRVHRIGQKRKTFVWRYLIDDTVEMKIDQYRVDHQEDQLEDSMVQGKACAIKAGGIDGGFQTEKELLDILQSAD